MAEKVNFSNLIADLEAKGITVHKISVMMHRQYVQVKRWKSGREPKYYDGLMLIEIHREFCSTGNITAVT